jgi:peroxiredoxin
MPTESKPIELGTPCPSFDLLAVDGKRYTRESFSQSKLMVVAFTCNHCPYVQAYEQRLMDLVGKFSSQGVAFVCINANDSKTYPEDSFEGMKDRAKKLGFNFHYLWDESQTVAKSFNAACTPEFYVYDADRKLRYHGRLDDNHKDPSAVKARYLESALDALLAGQTLRTAQTAAMGCSIKWKV